MNPNCLVTKPGLAPTGPGHGDLGSTLAAWSPALANILQFTQQLGSPGHHNTVTLGTLELATKVPKDFTIMEKAPTTGINLLVWISINIQ